MPRPIVCLLVLLTLGATFGIWSDAAWAADGVRACYGTRGERVVTDDGADRLMTPASVAKLFVVAAALHHLGPDHRVTTRAWMDEGATLEGGVLGGDLVVEAAADPTWSARFFGAPTGSGRGAASPVVDLARQIAARGVRRVEGDLVVDRGAFGGRTSPASRAISEVSFGYGAPTSALAVDEGALPIEIAPGPRVGAPATVRALRRTSLRLVNRMITAPASLAGRGTVEAQPVWGSRTVILRGDYPLGEPSYRLELAVPDGDLAAGEALRAALDAQGITIDGEVRLETSGVALGFRRTDEPLALVTSPPLRVLLEPILAESENWLAEMLLLRLGAHVRRDGRPEIGLDVIADLLTDEVGVERASFVLDDASGLSPYSLVMPRTVVALLEWARRQPWGPLFVESMAASGQGTLAAWPALPPGTRAKTGTLRHVLALAGVVPGSTTAGTPPLVFACMLNHRPDERPALRRELVSTVRGLAATRSTIRPR